MCTCPNYMVWTGKYTRNDRPQFDFVGHHQYKQVIDKYKDLPFVQVPCGTCLECRIQHARQWADRCVLEAKHYKDNYFVTLTYDDDFLPDHNSLEPRDLQLFLKRLRKAFPKTKIRFLACGEYGDTSFRPHYHLILFNCPLNDLSYNFLLCDNAFDVKFFKAKPHFINHLRPNNKGDLLFSKLIYDCWHYQGMISVAKFNYDTAAYVSQYVTKKCNPKMKNLYKELNIKPEYLVMSRRPGIGAEYFHQHDNIHDIGHVIIPSDGDAHISSVPRYYDKLFVAKYGEDVFAPYQVKRVQKKFQNIDTYLHSLQDKDHENKMRDYNLKKMQRLREQL